MRVSIIFIIIFSLGLNQKSVGQTFNQDVIPSITPASIPSAPAFALLGVNPEIVTRPSDVKQFKVDWRIKNYNLAPDLAIEIQPVWWFIHRKKGIKAYRESSKLAKILSTASFSLATAKIDNANHMSYALKLNVYKEKDPLLDDQAIKNKEKQFNELVKPLQDSIKALNKSRKEIQDRVTMEKADSLIVDLTQQIDFIKIQNLKQLRDESEQFVLNNWNMDMIDVAFGRVFKYDNTALDSLKFDKAGFGLWVNGAKGVGKNGLLTGMIRMNRIGANTNWLYGASYRHGSERFNFFFELVRSAINNNIDNGFEEDEIFAVKRSEDIGSAWFRFQDGEGYKTWTLSYGGDFRLSKKILLNFSLRTELKAGQGFNRFLPVANIICLME